MSGVQSVTLERDGQGQPWGFRLQGGSDLGSPLSVQRVLVGTPAEGVLRRGDVVLSIGKFDVKKLSHQQAADLFAEAGNTITVTLKRTASPAKPTTPTLSSATKSILTSAKSHESFSLSRSATLPRNFMRNYHAARPALYEPPSYKSSRNTVIIQPPERVLAELGPGSASHLKKQIAWMGGYQECDPVKVHDNVKGAGFGIAKHQVYQPVKQDLILPGFNARSKVYSPQGWKPKGTGYPKLNGPTQSSQFSSLPSPSPIPIQPTTSSAMKKSLPVSYNSPINLYSTQNVSEVAHMNAQGQTPIPSMNRLITPQNKPRKRFSPSGALPPNYFPELSATWQAIQEEEDCHLITEHGPSSSKVYSL